MTDTTKRDFLLIEFPQIIKNLNSDTEGKFGLMTPQHMVEHLIMTIKITAKKHEGERELPANKRQLGFQRFIRNGAILEHRPSDKTKADLPPLKYSSVEEAISFLPEAIQRFYNFWDDNQDYKPYAAWMGALSFEELELFHFMHFRYHLWQFDLIDSYPKKKSQDS